MYHHIKGERFEVIYHPRQSSFDEMHIGEPLKVADVSSYFRDKFGHPHPELPHQNGLAYEVLTFDAQQAIVFSLHNKNEFVPINTFYDALRTADEDRQYVCSAIYNAGEDACHVSARWITPKESGVKEQYGWFFQAWDINHGGTTSSNREGIHKLAIVRQPRARVELLHEDTEPLSANWEDIDTLPYKQTPT